MNQAFRVGSFMVDCFAEMISLDGLSDCCA